MDKCCSKPSCTKEKAIRAEISSEKDMADESRGTITIKKELMNENMPKATQPSQILASNLTQDEMVEVLTYLKREDVNKVLALTPLLKRFRLAKYYCPQHGSPREADLEVHGDVQEEKEDDNLAEAKDDEAKEEEENAAEKAGDAQNQVSSTPDAKQVPTMNSSVTDQVVDITSGLTEIKLEEAHLKVSTSGKISQENAKPKKLQFEDCIQAKIGRVRCPKCDFFSWT